MIKEARARRLRKNSAELVLACTQRNLDARLEQRVRSLIKAGIDWGYFIESAQLGGVTTLAYRTLSTIRPLGRIPQEALANLKSNYILITFKTALQHQELTGLLKFFAQKGIVVSPLKGTFLAGRLYGDIAARGLSADIDLLIKEEDKQRVAALLQKLGYVFGSDKEIPQRQWQYSFFKPKAAGLDLHWDITMMGRSQARIEGLWQDSRLREEDGISYYEFQSEELLLYLSAHLANSSRLRQLKYVCDIDALLRKYADDLDWGRISQKARNWRVSGSVYAALRLSQDLFVSPLPQRVLAGLRPNLLTRMWTKMIFNQEVFLGRGFRKRLVSKFLCDILFELLEARQLSDYAAIVKRVLLPPVETLRCRKAKHSKPALCSYLWRIASGAGKLLRSILGK